MTKLTQQFPFPVSKVPLPDVVEDSAPWVAEETATCDFQDARLSKRLRALLGQLANDVGAPIPFACQDWANTKAAYRFLSNERVNEPAILGGHFQSTAGRFAACSGLVLVLQDTTAFTYYRNNPKAIGEPYKAIVRNGVARKQTKSMCGILMHSSLAVTTQGVPLGLAAIKFWSRSRYKGCNALKRKVNPTRVPIQSKESIRWLENLRQSTRLFADPERCVHVGDRESDIYELFCTACELKTHFLVRTCVDRLAGDGRHTITNEMDEVRVKGLHHVEVVDSKGKPAWATLELRYRRVHVLPPIGKQKDYPALILTVIYARERGAPQGRKPIDWKLITDLPVSSRSEAIEKLHWYAQRWKIETFHKILKSGCRAEDAKLRTADRLANLVSILCIVSWRIFWMTMMNRALPDVPATLALTQTEADLLDRLVVDKRNAVGSGDLSHYLNKIARLGGYLDRAHDAPPGNTVMWRGLTRLIYIELGFNLGTELMGN